ncbi:hypothetical protein EPJ74_10185 [Brachyspira aalborgi]|uniref:Uncharacterized protein n=1 Tax=Brachyspira aalborgi TaxID=29522 RepID=A0A5C8GCH9_9SPIR|nr:hypothetical protein [Brachyspira aalborgi]TXJ59469.1 hypothetical protein EPJ74_10185 [Brachyspira aalborgi]
MKEQTKNSYLSIILSLIALFLISCDNKDKTGAEEAKKEERTLSYYAGNWWGKAPRETAEKNIFTINTDGSFTIKGDGGNEDLIIPSSLVTRVNDTNYTALYSAGSDSVNYTFIFTSDTQGKFTMGLEGQSATVDITKK